MLTLLIELKPINKVFFEGAPPVNGKKRTNKLKTDIEGHTGNILIEWKP